MRVWAVTGAWLIGGAVLVALGAVVGRLGDLRRERASEARTQESIWVIGTAPGGTFIGQGGDTLVLGHTSERWVLIYATKEGCRPCRALTHRLAKLGATWPSDNLELWWTGTPTADEIANLRRQGVRVRRVYPVPGKSVLDDLAVSGVPYLSLVDPEGIIHRVRIGYWRQMDIEAFVSSADQE